MRTGLAVTLCAAALAGVSNLALAAPLSLPALQPAITSGRISAANQSGIRPAVLEIVIPNSLHRVVAHPATGQDGATPAANVVQWLTGAVPSRCQHGTSALPGSHACLVI